jgi:hypothetical protein
MTAVALLHHGETVEVPFRRVVSQCNVFEDSRLLAAPYLVRSSVSRAIFQEFVAAIEGKAIAITNKNFEGLSQLSAEFGFEALSEKLSEFRASPAFEPVKLNDEAAFSLRIVALEEAELRREREIAGLQGELAQQGGAEQSTAEALTAALARISRLEAEVSELRSASEVFSATRLTVTRLQCDFLDLMNAYGGLAPLARMEVLQRSLESTQGSVQSMSAEVTQLRAVLFATKNDVPPTGTPVPSPPAAAHAWSPRITNTVLPLNPLCATKKAVPIGFDSLIVSDFPDIFAEFRGKRFSLLWRGTRHGFGCADFHSRCDDHANTMTVILDTHGNVFGGFTPVEWESSSLLKEDDDEQLHGDYWKADDSLRSFLFTLENPHNIPARRFALKAQEKGWAIYCASGLGPVLGNGIAVHDNCNADTYNFTSLGVYYTNDTGLDGRTVFTGSYDFQVKEIEVFEITK